MKIFIVFGVINLVTSITVFSKPTLSYHLFNDCYVVDTYVNSMHHTIQNAGRKPSSKSAQLNQLVKKGENVIKVVVTDAELSEKRKKGGVRHFSTELKLGDVDMKARKVLNEKLLFAYSLTEYFEFIKVDDEEKTEVTEPDKSKKDVKEEQIIRRFEEKVSSMNMEVDVKDRRREYTFTFTIDEFPVNKLPWENIEREFTDGDKLTVLSQVQEAYNALKAKDEKKLVTLNKRKIEHMAASLSSKSQKLEASMARFFSRMFADANYKLNPLNIKELTVEKMPDLNLVRVTRGKDTKIISAKFGSGEYKMELYFSFLDGEWQIVY